LYYTVNATLPVMAANPATGGYTLVSAVDNTSGAPSVGGGSSGTWIEVTRDTLGAANFTLSSTMANYDFAGWDESAVAGINNATYFAIVVSFAQVPVGSSVEVEHISLQKGYIPTAPGAMSFGETLAALQQYYSKSFALGTIPATNAGTTNCVEWSQAQLASASALSPPFFYPTTMRKIPTVIIYNPSAANNQAYNVVQGSCSATSAAAVGTNNFNVSFISPAGSIVTQGVIAHWSADARYGVV
jgi:hypothetical protein